MPCSKEDPREQILGLIGGANGASFSKMVAATNLDQCEDEDDCQVDGNQDGTDGLVSGCTQTERKSRKSVEDSKERRIVIPKR